MSNINKTSSIDQLIHALSSKTKIKVRSSNLKLEDNDNHQKTIKDPNKLKKEIVLAINKFDLSEHKGLDLARETLINQMIRWQFSEATDSKTTLSNLMIKVNQKIAQSDIARHKLNSLVLDLHE